MGIGAPPPSAPRGGTGWVARTVAALVLLVLGGCGWLYGWPPEGSAFDDGPVVVLGGGAGDRIAEGLEIVGEPREGRELVLSPGAAARFERLDGSCDDPWVRCIEPEPDTTYGEAMTVSRLAVAHDWPAVTVVTSEYHVTRTRLLFSACMRTPARVVASASHRSLQVRVHHLVREPIATVLSLPVFAYCPP